MVQTLPAQIQAAIVKRKNEIGVEKGKIAGLKVQIGDNVQTISADQKDITSLQNDPTVSSLQKQIQSIKQGDSGLPELQRELAAAESTKIPAGTKYAIQRAAKAAQVAALRARINDIAAGRDSLPSLEGQLAAQIGQDQLKIGADNADIQKLYGTNVSLGGDKDKVGKGGQIGQHLSLISKLTGQITGSDGLNTALSEVTGSGQYAPLALQGASGVGGLLGPDQIQLQTLQDEMAQLGNGPLAAALAAAQAQYSSSTSSTTDDSTLVGLLQQQNELLANEYAVSQRQYSVLADLPYGGSFSTGGVVPGPVGAATAIIAHGGEIVTSIADQRRGGGETTHKVELTLNKNLLDIIDARIQTHGRSSARKVAKRLPSHGGGLLTAR